jgi:hypothetical protein
MQEMLLEKFIRLLETDMENCISTSANCNLTLGLKADGASDILFWRYFEANSKQKSSIG